MFIFKRPSRFKKIKIKYCQTTKMLKYFYTQPLQGELSRFFRDILIGYIFIDKIIYDNIEMKESVRILVENKVLG